MASSEGHIHWDGAADSVVNYLGQDLQITAEVSNADTVGADPAGTVRIRLNGSVLTGLALPNTTWETIPGTSPALEALAEGHYPLGYVRVRAA